MNQNASENPNVQNGSNSLPILHSKDLFGDKKEIHIHHQGETYRLRITSRGKLILQK